MCKLYANLCVNLPTWGQLGEINITNQAEQGCIAKQKDDLKILYPFFIPYFRLVTSFSRRTSSSSFLIRGLPGRGRARDRAEDSGFVGRGRGDEGGRGRGRGDEGGRGRGRGLSGRDSPRTVGRSDQMAQHGSGENTAAR